MSPNSPHSFAAHLQDLESIAEREQINGRNNTAATTEGSRINDRPTYNAADLDPLLEEIQDLDQTQRDASIYAGF